MPWIDESNEHYKEMALRYSQISEWLKELKAYRDMWDKVIDVIKSRYEEILKATKYGNKNKEQLDYSYRSMLMYEVAYIIEDIIETIEIAEREMAESESD